MTKAMEACGMKVSKLDPCLFVGDKVLCISYVDDILFWAKDEADIIELATLDVQCHCVDGVVSEVTTARDCYSRAAKSGSIIIEVTFL